MKYVKRGNSTILSVSNEITIKNIDIFRENMEQFLADSGQLLIVNLSDVTYLNSSALGTIADTAMKAKQAGKELIVAGIQPSIGEIFKIVQFERFIKLFSSLDEAEVYFSVE